ncbi:MAG: glucose 1-dehydrogenase [Chloroflexi bacterium]|nr:glucose 1-dehydrogenase [Chloroflexota bacterium]
MKSIAVVPGKPKSIHLQELPMPSFDPVQNQRETLVKVLKVGLCGTDREIASGEYGEAPAGYNFLVLGHENLGAVEEVGNGVTEVSPGDYVVSMVRQPGTSHYDRLGMHDMTTDETYYEHGISRLHGFLTEYYVTNAEFLVRIPEAMAGVGVLLEPLSIVEKGVQQAYEIQRRMRMWKPARAAVLGAGTIGLLATLVLRLKGLDVVTMALTKAPYLNSELVERLGARYFSTREVSLTTASETHGPFDLIFEATGFSPLAFESMEVLGKNGVLILSSVTGGSREIKVPADVINQSFVLGNKAMVGTISANREHYEAGVRDIVQAYGLYRGWLSSLITHSIDGLENYGEALNLLSSSENLIKLVVNV